MRNAPGRAIVLTAPLGTRVPDIGVEVQTLTGRRYKVTGHISKRGRQFRCVVLAPDAPASERVQFWNWPR